jgi:hypothetical protein
VNTGAPCTWVLRIQTAPTPHKLEARGEPGAWRHARPVRRAGRGNGPRDNLGTAPRPDPYGSR